MEGSIDLDKFPTSRVHQLAKKFKGSLWHIKQVAGDLQATHINLTQLNPFLEKGEKQFSNYLLFILNYLLRPRT